MSEESKMAIETLDQLKGDADKTDEAYYCSLDLAITAIKQVEAAIAYINADERMFPYPETPEEKGWNSCVRVMRDGILEILEE